MAHFYAISNVCEGIIELLRNAFDLEDFQNQQMDFRVYMGTELATQPMAQGISIFLYRVYPNNCYRTPPGRLSENGNRLRGGLPLDLHMLLTAWAPSASLQYALLGWAMRVLEDNPILPAGLLNARIPGVFRNDETVEITLCELTNEDLFRIWETVTENKYQVSVPYVARYVTIESRVEIVEGLPVQQRRLDMGKLSKNDA